MNMKLSVDKHDEGGKSAPSTSHAKIVNEPNRKWYRLNCFDGDISESNTNDKFARNIFQHEISQFDASFLCVCVCVKHRLDMTNSAAVCSKKQLSLVQNVFTLTHTPNAQ